MAAHMGLRTNFVSLTFIVSCMVIFCRAQDDCQLPLYHMANLTQRIWTFSSNTSCLPHNETESDCQIHMKFCSPLKLNQECGENAAVCQTLLESNHRLAGYVAKPFTEYTDPSKGFSTGFPQGDTYSYTSAGKTVNCNLSTIINFSCNKDKMWVPSADGSNPQQVPFPPLEIKFNNQTCQYNITFEFAGACLTNNPAMVIDNQLSAGSVLVILFFVVVLAYFVLGTMWNIGCRGARGKEVIPNLDFWTMLPVYIADGVLFTFRCGQMESSSYDSI